MEKRELVEIREMEARDAGAVARLTGELGYERTPDSIQQWIETAASHRHGQAAYVACLGGEVVGWIEVSLEHRLQSEDFALIGGLVVTREHRGRRIGERLCEQAEAWSREHGAARLRLTSRSTRADAHRFYQREGFDLVKTSLVFEKKLR